MCYNAVTASNSRYLADLSRPTYHHVPYCLPRMHVNLRSRYEKVFRPKIILPLGPEYWVQRYRNGIYVWMKGWMDGWNDGWTDGRTDGRTVGWMGGWMGGWMDGSSSSSSSSSSLLFNLADMLYETASFGGVDFSFALFWSRQMQLKTSDTDLKISRSVLLRAPF